MSLRCAEVFANPQPSIDVARLAEMAPEDIAPDFLHAGTIPISAALLALRYHFLQSTEVIEAPEIAADVVPPEDATTQEDPASPGLVNETAQVTPVINIPETAVPITSFEQRIDDPVVEAVAAPPDIPPPPAASLETQPEPLESLPAAPPVEPPAQMISLPPTPAPPPRSSPSEADQADSKAIPRPRPAVRIPEKRTIFNILPALRRQSPLPKPVLPPTPQEVEPVSTEKAQITPDESPASISEPASEAPAEAPVSQEAVPLEEILEPQEEPAPWEEATATPAEPSPLEPKPTSAAPEPTAATPEPEVSTTFPIEHLPPTALKPRRAMAQEFESAPDEGLVSQDRLQEIFMTEEHLTLDQVLKLCGGLPGIRSCILTKGSSVLSAFNVPDGIDLVSLTGNASAMLDAMRASSMRMGLGAIPAVTVHSEKGPVSFFHSDDLAMLIIHADRGFIPGVREKIYDVVVALGQSNFPLPLEGSSEK